jgi:WD40 repeat protein
MNEPVHTLTITPTSTINHMTIMNDGTLVTAGSDCKIRFWRAKDEVNAG